MTILFKKLCLIMIAISVSILLPKLALSEVTLTDEVMGVIKGACGPASYAAAIYTGCVCYLTHYGFRCTNAVKHYSKGKCDDTNNQDCSISDAPLVVCTVTYACRVATPSEGCQDGTSNGCEITPGQEGTRTYGNTVANASGSECTPGGGCSGGGWCGI